MGRRVYQAKFCRRFGAWAYECDGDSMVEQIEGVLVGYGLAEYVPPSGSVIMEIGANCGLLSMVLAQRQAQCTVYAVEPNPRVFQGLVRGVVSNGLHNTVPLCLAVGDGQPIEIQWLKGQTGGGSGWTTRVRGHELVTVPTITFEALLDMLSITEVELLVLDCEGAEHVIARSPAMARVKRTICELHTNDRTRSLGYSVENTTALLGANVTVHPIEMSQ